jgi:hypothetical protein
MFKKFFYKANGAFGYVPSTIQNSYLFFHDVVSTKDKGTKKLRGKWLTVCTAVLLPDRLFTNSQQAMTSQVHTQLQDPGSVASKQQRCRIVDAARRQRNGHTLSLPIA